MPIRGANPFRASARIAAHYGGSTEHGQLDGNARIASEPNLTPLVLETVSILMCQCQFGLPPLWCGYRSSHKEARAAAEQVVGAAAKRLAARTIAAA